MFDGRHRTPWSEKIAFADQSLRPREGNPNRASGASTIGRFPRVALTIRLDQHFDYRLPHGELRGTDRIGYAFGSLLKFYAACAGNLGPARDVGRDDLGELFR